jgi:20S proteasome subunit beta 2
MLVFGLLCVCIITLQNSGLDSRVNTAVTMLKRHLYGYQGHVSAACVLGGVDITGPHLYTVYPHGR